MYSFGYFFWQRTILTLSITYNQPSIASEARALLVLILLSKNCRKGSRLGHDSLVDGMLKDGLWDVYGDVGMGVCAEICADNHVISREEQVWLVFVLNYTHILLCE